jgi:hypothetical protein
MGPTQNALAFPRERAGEIARVTFARVNDVPTQGRIVRADPTTGSYVVRAKCTASEPGTTLTYLVIDATPRIDNEERVLTSGIIRCDDSAVTISSATPLVGKEIQIRFSHISERVTRAYAVIVPQ